MNDASRRQWMIYGATGYTGTLLAEEAVRRGHRPVLAGRSEETLARVAGRLGLPHLTVGLDDASKLRAALEGISCVLHAAGPFNETSAPMVQACLDAGAHCLDITGEVSVMESVFERSHEARERGIALISGVGFDVVPTDCLAKHVAQQLGDVQSLEIAIAVVHSRPSPGTAKSALGTLPFGGHVRRDGQLEALPLGQGVRRITFSKREAWAVPVPLGDSASAHRSTGARNITTYLAIPEAVASFLRVPVATAASTFFTQLLLRSRTVQQFLSKQLEQRIRGPDAATRLKGKSFAWARAEDSSGKAVEGWMETIEGYSYTALSGVRAVEQILANPRSGALSPAMAFGADFALGIEGTTRLDSL